MAGNMRAGDIAFYSVAAFLFGIFIIDEHWNTDIVLVALAIATIIVWIANHGARKYILAIFLSVIVGIGYCLVFEYFTSFGKQAPIGKNETFLGTVMADPKPAGNFTMLALALSRPHTGSIDIFTFPDSQFHYGDLLWIHGTVSAPSYAGADPAAFLPQIKLITPHNGSLVEEKVIEMRSFIAKKFAELFSVDKAALLTSMILGTTAGMSAALKAQMEISGSAYIVGMFGFKIAIIGSTLLAALKDVMPRKIVLALVLSVIWIFVFVSGGTISALRAGIMGSVALAAPFFGRIMSMRNALTFTACVLTVIDPAILADAGFQLSFLSFLGIYYLRSPINNLFHWHDAGWLRWKEHAMLSFSTNLAIVPVVMGTFGSFSLTSFISNILIMIPWSPMMFLGVVTACVDPLSSALAFFPAQLENIFLSYELFIVRIFSVFVIPMPAIFNSDFIIIFYYGLLMIFIYYYGRES